MPEFAVVGADSKGFVWLPLERNSASLHATDEGALTVKVCVFVWVE